MRYQLQRAALVAALFAAVAATARAQLVEMKLDPAIAKASILKRGRPAQRH